MANPIKQIKRSTATVRLAIVAMLVMQALTLGGVVALLVRPS